MLVLNMACRRCWRRLLLDVRVRSCWSRLSQMCHCKLDGSTGSLLMIPVMRFMESLGQISCFLRAGDIESSLSALHVLHSACTCSLSGCTGRCSPLRTPCTHSFSDCAGIFPNLFPLRACFSPLPLPPTRTCRGGAQPDNIAVGRHLESRSLTLNSITASASSSSDMCIKSLVGLKVGIDSGIKL